MLDFDYVACHNLGPSKMNAHNGWPRPMFQ
jgi:hypothetical protein